MMFIWLEGSRKHPPHPSGLSSAVVSLSAGEIFIVHLRAEISRLKAKKEETEPPKHRSVEN